ncbi:MAG: YbjN domain-containing protein [Robiginitomaculum sp.]
MQKTLMTLGATLLMGASFAFAPVAAAKDIHTRFTADELMEILKAEGYSAVEDYGDGDVKIKINGKNYVLFNQPDGDLQGYYAMTGYDLSTDDMNEWNRTKRLSRAYLDNDDDPVIEADLLANGGLSHENVSEFFEVFTGSVSQFRKFVAEHDDD